MHHPPWCEVCKEVERGQENSTLKDPFTWKEIIESRKEALPHPTLMNLLTPCWDTHFSWWTQICYKKEWPIQLKYLQAIWNRSVFTMVDERHVTMTVIMTITTTILSQAVRSIFYLYYLVNYLRAGIIFLI